MRISTALEQGLVYRMRILMVHNRYQQHGGEDTVYDAEVALLRQYGHTVTEFTRDNSTLVGRSRVGVAALSVWSGSSRDALSSLAVKVRPDIVHIHNTHLIITPSAYYLSTAARVPIVQTLHNFRLLCPNALLFRQGRVCEKCVGKSVAWPGVLHRCYRDSRAATLAVATTLAVHSGLGTWQKRIHRYIALTQFARAKFIEGGLPPDRIAVKPNFAFDRSTDTEFSVGGAGALFVGRLSKEKGIRTLLDAWRDLKVPLNLVGDGPLRAVVQEHENPFIQICGPRSPEEVANSMRQAAFLVLPSECYEGFAVVIAEAFCHGLPVIASSLGAMAEAIIDGECGLLFSPGNVSELAAKVRWAASHPEEMAQMGLNARRRYEERYSPEANYSNLMGIYDEAVQEKIGELAAAAH